jgi:hypothetical protein
LTRPGSSPGGWSPAVVGSLPVSRQAWGCPVPLAAGGCVAGGAGRAAAMASSAWAQHRQDGVAAEGGPGPDLVPVQSGLPLALLVAFFDGPPLPGDHDQGGQGHRPALGEWQ